MITIIIPYFQRKAGVLAKALSSIATQKNCKSPLHVIIVNDESPAPPEPEIEAVCFPDTTHVRLINQPNGGPGAARNTGLDAVPDGTRLIAFLDSDDEWSEDHLARAELCLDISDFYFANHYQLGQSVGAFERGGRIDVSEHQSLTNAPDQLFRYSGDLFDQILRGNVIGTSTVVYRWIPLASLRFQIEYTTAGEDYLFWMAITKQGVRTTFSTRIEAIYGKGVNVYAGSTWGTDTHLLRVHQETRYRLAVRKHFELSAIQRKHILNELKKLRIAFAQDVLHRLRHFKGFPNGLLFQHAKLDPAAIITLPWLIVQILVRR